VVRTTPDRVEAAAVVVPDLVEYLVVVAPDPVTLASTAESLAGLQASGAIRLLDLVVLVKDLDGGIELPDVGTVPALASFAGIERDAEGLLTNQDIELVSVAVPPGRTGMILVAEDRWAEPLSMALQRVGGHIVAGERIARARVLAVLSEEPTDHTEEQ
jgi:hypothetical protein